MSDSESVFKTLGRLDNNRPVQGQQEQRGPKIGETGKPKDPVRLEAVQTTTDGIKLQWNPVDSNQLYGYLLERSTAFNENSWRSVHHPKPVLRAAITKFTVGNVKPYENYDFCVKSAVLTDNEGLIYSDPGCKLRNVVAKEKYQPYQPRDIKVKDITEESISLKWKEPLPDDDYDIPVSYEYIIEMCDYGDGNINSAFKECYRTEQLECTVKVQHSGTCHFRLSAHNKDKNISSLPKEIGNPEVRITVEEKNGERIKTITSRWQVSHTTVNDIEQGCVIFVVSCEDMTGLRELWMNYKLGKLKKLFQDLFTLEASLASEGSIADLDLNIRIHPKDFHSSRRHLMLTCATDRGFRVVNMEDAHFRANIQLGLSEDYPVYCKPLSPRTTCSQLDYLDPAIPTDQIHVTVVQNLAQRQIELQEDMVRSLQREVTRLTREQETAQKLLLDNKKEIEELTGANKGMENTIAELLAEKTKLANKLAMKEHEDKLTDDKVESLQREVTHLTPEKEAAQKELSNKRKELEDLTGASKGNTTDERIGPETDQENAKAIANMGQVVTEKQLATLARKLGAEWEYLAIHLGLTKADVYRCKQENMMMVDGQIFSMLMRWKSKKGSNATVEKLIEELRAFKPPLEEEKYEFLEEQL